MRQTIEQIAKIQHDQNKPLLSNYNAEWWADYLQHYQVIDYYFVKKYGKFYYWEVLNNDTTEEKEDNAEAFTDSVRCWLYVNNKKLSELWRINVVSDEDLNFLNNYDMTETKEEETNEGARQDGTTRTIAQRQNSGTLTTGAHIDTNTEQVSPNDSDTWNNEHKTINDNAQRIDSTSQTIGGGQDSDQYNKGAQKNTNEYTLRRYGNIGVQTTTDMMAKFNEFWSGWDFYNFIFNAICKEYMYSRDYGTLEDWICN